LNGSTGRRQVTVRWKHRHVSIGSDDDGAAALRYPGIAVSHLLDGHPVHELWLPSGDPTEADDEVLITVLRAALLWSAHPTESSVGP
jgi:hypothetical protein